MNAIATKKAQRFLYLKRLYELSEGNRLAYFPFAEIGQEFGWDVALCDDVTDYLKNEGLIEYPAFGTVGITHLGIKLIEKALGNPEEDMGYFPPANIIIVVGGNFTVGGDIIGRDKSAATS